VGHHAVPSRWAITLHLASGTPVWNSRRGTV
jgi:hypothetical protein